MILTRKQGKYSNLIPSYPIKIGFHPQDYACFLPQNSIKKRFCSHLSFLQCSKGKLFVNNL
jgi:hypothetical protein